MTEAPLIRIEACPLPDGARAEFLTAKDGARLRLVRYPRSGGPVRGTVLVMPGWSEFAEKYAEVATDLHARGYGVVVCDPRGQGYSQRLRGEDRRGHVTDFRVFVGDLTECLEEVRRSEPGPYAILAHSMGGLITLEWLSEGHGQDLVGVALSAPFTRLYANPFKTALVRGVLRAGKALGRGRADVPGAKEHSWQFDGNVLTQDASRHERFRQLQLAAPDAVAGMPKFDWLLAALHGHERVDAPGALERLSPPILIVSALRDETIDPSHHRALKDRYPSTIHLVEVEGARHELLMEADPYRHRFWEAFDQYMDERFETSSSKAASSVPLT